MSRLNTKRDKGAGSIFKKGGKVKRKIGKDTAAKIDAIIGSPNGNDATTVGCTYLKV